MGTNEENKPQDEAALAAMMTEMVNAGGEKKDADATLSQDEIDNLLGFGSGQDIPTRGVDALLFRSRDNYEKFPMLEVVFDRFSRALSSTLRSFTGEVSEATVVNITSIKFEDYLNSIPLPAMITIFQATEWENLGLLTIDSSLVYRIVDLLLGGGKGGTHFKVDGRTFTTIEQDIIKNFTRVILEEMTSAFTPVTSVTFRLDRLETNPRFATITRPQNPIVIISCNIDFGGVGGKIDIIFPYQTLEPVKEALMQMFAGESFGSDVSWEPHLSDELISTDLKVRAQLDGKKITLKELANLKVGSTLVTNNRSDDDLVVTCNGIPLLKGKLGAFGENMAISLTDVSAIKGF